MPLMGSLYIGSSGLQNSQNALNTTAHNLSNIDTKGYTRQQVQLSDKRYTTLSIDINSVNNKQTGLGVTYSRAKQVRDFFLDKTYRRESGRSMFYEVSTEVLEQVESQLGEMNGESFQASIEDFYTSVQELSKNPASSVNQGLLVQKAVEFVERSTAVYAGLSSYQDNLNVQIKNNIDKINDYGKKILSLNDSIRAIEAGKIEHANDLRDTRNKILDELAELADISFAEDIYGSVSVQIEGVDFVKGGSCYEIMIDIDPNTDFYTPFWPQNAKFRVADDGSRKYSIEGAEVFNLKREISSDLSTDIGGLKAMLLARGDHRADYTDIQGDYDSISQSVLMNIQAEFDQLVHGVATKINSILAEASGVKQGSFIPDGETESSEVQFCNVDPDGYLRRADGSPMQLFTKIVTDGYRKVTGTVTYQDAEGNDRTETGEFWIYNEEDPKEPESLYSVKNLQISQEILQEPGSLGFRLPDGSEDIVTAEKLKNAFSEEAYTLNPNVKKKASFVDYYTDMVSQVANSGSVYRSIYLNQESTVESTESAREQVIGVSSDEELSNMIKFQNAYNASSRYINVISEMLEHIISTLGR